MLDEHTSNKNTNLNSNLMKEAVENDHPFKCSLHVLFRITCRALHRFTSLYVTLRNLLFMGNLGIHCLNAYLLAH